MPARMLASLNANTCSTTAMTREQSKRQQEMSFYSSTPGLLCGTLWR
uniref:Uncharacterized protein n=1 Tax=Arundo donax TaxID=35708 RepID=A0A0A8XWK1_ARUDO